MKKSALQIADAVSAKPEESSALRKAAPWLTAAGTGALGYGLLRRKSFAPIGTQLRSLQEAAKNKPFSIATSGGTPWAQRIRSMIMGAPTITTGEKTVGTVLHHTPSPRGGGDININAGGVIDALQDKAVFDRIMREGVGSGPGMASSLPDTMRLDEALKRVGGDPKRLKEIYPDFMLKARSESMGRGIFRSLDDPGVNEAIQNPSQFVFQNKMPIKNEFRVHTIDNEPFTATHRYLPNKPLRGLWDKMTGGRAWGGGGGAFVPLMGKRREKLHDFIRQSTAHLKPTEGKSLSDVGESMHAAWDVAELPDGSFKLIEANSVPGTMMNPVIAQKLQRQITGRWSKPVAALGGTALAGAAGITANKLSDQPMKKTADQISCSVLVKFAAGREGSHEVWRKQVDWIAKKNNLPRLTDKEFAKMFPKDFATSGKNLDETVRSSEWFKAHVSKPVGQANETRSTIKDELSPEDYAQWLNDFGHPRSQELLKHIQGIQLVDALGGLAGTTSGAITAHQTVQGARKAQTPAERYAVLGLGGGMAGLAGGSAYGHLKNLVGLNKVIPHLRRGDYYDGLDAFKNVGKTTPKFAPRYVGALAGLGLGLGGAALWNQLAKRRDNQKTAEITPEEMAAGLAGEVGRADITKAEILALGQKLREEAREKAKYSPLKHSLVGGALGAGALGSLGYIGSKALPKASRGGMALAAAGMGLGAGAGLGALTGYIHKALEGFHGKNVGETLGNISRTGHIPGEDDRRVLVSSLVPYATGTRPGATPVNPEEIDRYRNKNLVSGMGLGAVNGALGSLPLAFTMPGGNPTNIAKFIATAITAGILNGTVGSINTSNTLMDLRNRGYTQLAKDLREETFGIKD